MTAQVNSSAQDKRFEPGDKVVWNRYTEPLEAVVLRITPKRVQIEIAADNEQSMIRYVSPKNLDRITSTNHNPRRQPFSEIKEKGLAGDFSSTSTIFWQSFSGLLSLILGGILISLFTVWGNALKIYYPDNSEHIFFVAPLFGSFGLLFLVIQIIKKQFEEAFTAIESFRASIQYSFRGWVFAMILYTSFMLIPLFFGDWFGFAIIIADMVFLTVTFISIAVVIGSIQYFRLMVERFDVAHHFTLFSNEADISACQLGVLPYWERIRAFWNAVLIGLVGLIFVGSGFLISPNGNGIAIIVIFAALGLGGFGIFKAIQFFIFLSTPNLQSFEEEVSEKLSYSSRGVKNYYLVCNNRKFTTNSKTWKSIIEGYKYQLWYSPVNNHVVASELQSYKPGPSKSNAG